MMRATCYKSNNDSDKFNNNEDKVYLFLRRWVLVGHILDHIMDYMLDHMLDYMLDQRIIGFVILTLHFTTFFT